MEIFYVSLSLLLYFFVPFFGEIVCASCVDEFINLIDDGSVSNS